MKENHNDAIYLMLEELDQITVDELRRKPEYQACLKEHFELGNRLKDISPDLERYIVLSVHIREQERRAALLQGLAAGTGLKQVFEGTNQSVLQQFLDNSYLLEEVK